MAIKKSGLGNTVVIPSNLARALSASESSACNFSSNRTGGEGGKGLGINAL
jgi:hypothetical protein